jgi:hypothetical protein
LAKKNMNPRALTCMTTSRNGNEPRRYSHSCVQLIQFNTDRLRRMQSYLREREDVLMREMQQSEAGPQAASRAARLAEVQKVLVWMVTNLDAKKDVELA